MSNVFNALSRLAEPIGRDFGAADSQAQANLLNGFAAMFIQSMPSGTHDQEMQMAYITGDLTSTAKAFIERLAEFCKVGVE